MITTANRIAQVEEYYFSKKLAEVRLLDTPELPVINLGIGSPDMPPHPAVIAALVNSAQLPTSHGYQSYKGIPALRKNIASFYHKTYDVELNPETEILPLMGSKEGILHIMMAFLNEGDEVMIPDPGYPTYSSVAKLVGAAVRSYDLKEENNWSINIDELQQRDLTRTKMMVINYPHMPTGKLASEAELRSIVQFAKANNILLINDNPYSLILYETPRSILSIEGAKDIAIELNSLSKSHNMAGWRIGWAAAKQEFIDAILKVKSNMDSGMFLGLQEAAAVALQLDESWFKPLNKIYAQRKKLAYQLLHILQCTYSKEQSGLFAWARVPHHVQDVAQWIDEILYATNVFITPGFIFGKNGERFIRISLCANEDKLNEALQRVTHYLEQQIPFTSKKLSI
jgi:LL-diaminopimelate aminotransferase